MRVLRTTDVFLEVPSQFLRKRKKNLIFVVDRILKEGYQLIARTFRAQREGNRRYPMNGIQSQLDILRPEFVHEDGNRSNLDVTRRGIQ